jgi:phosphate starvation-inducible PhoH-like protein
MANRRKKVYVDQDAVYDEIVTQSVVKVNKFRPKTKSQEEYVKLIKDYEITICSGSAGTGKSHCAIATGLELVQDKSTKYKKLIICTPAVEAEEKLGFLPGTAQEKLEPYLASSMALVEKILSKSERDKLGSQKILEVEALSYIRGKTFSDCIVFLEEAQNITPNQMKTFLTRIGENCKFIISGDIEQSDKYKNGKQSGLFDAMSRLRVIPEIGFHDFMSQDIVRNPIITKILDVYNTPEPKRDDKPTAPSSQFIIEDKDPINENMLLPREILRKENIFAKFFKK